jgi:hypothetical protein
VIAYSSLSHGGVYPAVDVIAEFYCAETMEAGGAGSDIVYFSSRDLFGVIGVCNKPSVQTDKIRIPSLNDILRNKGIKSAMAITGMDTSSLYPLPGGPIPRFITASVDALRHR